MSNFAKIRPDMTSRTRSYLTNQRFRISGEKLEMQLYKKSALYLKRLGVQLRKTTWGGGGGGNPPPPRCGRGLSVGSEGQDQVTKGQILKKKYEIKF